jgi:hypothetical protein
MSMIGSYLSFSTTPPTTLIPRLSSPAHLTTLAMFLWHLSLGSVKTLVKQGIHLPIQQLFIEPLVQVVGTA